MDRTGTEEINFQFDRRMTAYYRMNHSDLQVLVIVSVGKWSSNALFRLLVTLGERKSRSKTLKRASANGDQFPRSLNDNFFRLKWRVAASPFLRKKRLFMSREQNLNEFLFRFKIETQIISQNPWRQSKVVDEIYSKSSASMRWIGREDLPFCSVIGIIYSRSFSSRDLILIMGSIKANTVFSSMSRSATSQLHRVRFVVIEREYWKNGMRHRLVRGSGTAASGFLDLRDDYWARRDVSMTLIWML